MTAPCMGALSVTHVLWSGDVGGIGRLVEDLAVEQRRSGLAVSVAFAQRQGPFAEHLRRIGISTLDLNLRSGYDLRPLRIRRGIAALRGSAVLHLHAFNLPLGVTTAATHRPVVFTDHGQNPVPGAPGVSTWAKRRALARLLGLRRVLIAANSDWTASRAAELYGIGRERITVVHNGTSGAERPLAGRPGPSAALRVTFVGRLAAFKRVDRLVRAVSLMGRRGAVRVNIAGEGPMEESLRELATRLGCDEAIEFAGYRSDVQGLLAETDVLVLPSQAEPFGLVVIEASLAGALPIVFADGGGALEALPPDGIIVEDERELSEVLDRLAADPSARDPSRRAGRSLWTAEHFSIVRAAASYRRLYDASASDEIADSSGATTN